MFLLLALVFYFLGIVYIPMGLMAVSVHGTILAVVPWVVIPAIFRAFVDYLLVCVLMVFIGVMSIGVRMAALIAVAFLASATGSGLVAIGFVILLAFPLFAVTMYFWIVVMRLLGLLYRRNEKKLAWFEGD